MRGRIATTTDGNAGMRVRAPARPGALGALASMAAVALWQPASAAATLYQSEQAVANFGFASQLGSGIYAVSGRTVQIYRLPFSWELAPAREDRWGLAVTLPVTVGFYDFRLADVLESQLPNHIDTYSVVPGLELSRLLGHGWRVAAFAEAGPAHEGSNSTSGFVYAGGLKATCEFTPGKFRARYHVALLDAAADYESRAQDSMVRLTNAFEARRSLGVSWRGQSLDWGAYVLNEWYLVRPTPPLTASGPGMAPLQSEFGVTFGTVQAVHIWKVPVPRLGLGYRFGKNLSAWRIVLGAGF
jgi:hypothetical protein